MSRNYVFEHYNSITELLDTINNRPNNSVMRDESSSHTTGNSDWYGTASYEEAENLLKFGQLDHLDAIKTLVKENKQTLVEKIIGNRAKQHNMQIGFVPNVANALQNRPDSMINVIKNPLKKKTVELVYMPVANCGTNGDSYIKAGAAVVSALELIEKAGIRTKLICCFKFSESGEEVAGASLLLKNYSETFNIKKVCFPLINPAMQRRIGFKFLETTPNLTESGFASGYGRTFYKEEDIHNAFGAKSIVTDNTCYLSLGQVIGNNYSVNYILDRFGITLG